MLADPVTAHEQRTYTHEGTTFRLRNVVPGRPEVADTVRSHQRPGSNALGAIAYGLRSDLSRDGKAKTPSVDITGRVRLRDPGFNVLDEQAPTLDATGPHAVAYGGNRQSGPVEVATAVRAKGGTGHGDFESETFVAVPMTFDHQVGGTERSYIHDKPGRSRALTSNKTLAVAVPILEVNKRTNGDGYRDGDGLGQDGDPMYTLQAGAQHGIAVPIRASGAVGSNGAGIGADGDPSLTLDCTGSAAIAFDTTQVTSPGNISNPQPGDPCHPLAARAHAPAVAFKPSHYTRDKDGAPSEIVPPLSADADKGDQDMLVFESRKAQSGQSGKGDGAPLAFQVRTRADGRSVETQEDVAYSLMAPNGGGRRQEMNVAAAMSVRRLTPRECERLQGFSDDFTLIPYRGSLAADGPRYRAIGNAMAVPVVRWILGRILGFERETGDA